MTEASSTTLSEAIQPPLVAYPTLKVWAERILLAFLLLLFVVRGFIPAWRHLDSDFANYYLVARLYREGYPVERVYEWTWFQRQKDHFGIDRPLVGFAPSTPTSALLVVPLASMPPLVANRWWLAINLALLSLTGVFLKRITSLPWRRIGVLVFLAIAPLHMNFLTGQVHLVMLLLVAVAAWLYFADRVFLCGIALGAAAALKIYPALFLLFFLVKKQWRAAAGLLCGMLGAVLVSAGLFGVAACRIYFREILPWGLRGEITDPFDTGWDSLNALLRRLLLFEPELNPAPVAHLPHLFAILHSLLHTLILTAFLWAIVSLDGSQSRRKLEWASYCFLLLLLSSEPLPYHFLILILTAVLVVDCLIAGKKPAWAAAIVIVYALICVPYDRLYRAIPTGWASVFFFPRLFWMLVLAGMLLWLLLSESGQTLSERVRSRSFAQAALIFAALFATSLVLNVRHMKGQFDNNRARVTTSIGSAIAIDPVVTDDAIFYGALLPRFREANDMYAVHRLHAGQITAFGGGGDWFHPAATADGLRSWAEVASASSSRIVRFEASADATGDEAVVTEAADAQQPAVSPDAKWLAYIREVRGRGSLWVRPLGGTQGESSSAPERELAGPEYDVREFGFSPDAQVFFSSWQTRQYRLYSVDSQSGAIAELTSARCSARYPALSPDGRWIAFSCERDGVWQLVAMNLRTAEQRQLTSADCNSITPAWTRDSKSLIYAADCGRALGVTALSKIDVVR
jgi:hypothetical protein